MSEKAGAEPSRYARTVTRPLELALAIRSGMPVVHFDGTPVSTGVEALRRNFAGTVPVILDQVSDWWDSVGNNKWPDDRLESSGRLPWPRLWAEWRETTQNDAMNGLLMTELPREAALRTLPSSIASSAKALRGDYLITTQWFCSARGAPRIVVAPPVIYGALASGETVKSPDGTTPLVTHTAAWPEALRTPKEIISTFVVWRLFSALLCVRGTIVQDVAMPRASRRRFARIPDSAPPWIAYKTLSVDLKLPGSAAEQIERGTIDHAPRGVPLHLVRAHIADYRTGKGLFGKYRGLVWRSAHRRGYQRLGVVAKTYEAIVQNTPQQSVAGNPE